MHVGRCSAFRGPGKAGSCMCQPQHPPRAHTATSTDIAGAAHASVVRPPLQPAFAYRSSGILPHKVLPRLPSQRCASLRRRRGRRHAGEGNTRGCRRRQGCQADWTVGHHDRGCGCRRQGAPGQRDAHSHLTDGSRHRYTLHHAARNAGGGRVIDYQRDAQGRNIGGGQHRIRIAVAPAGDGVHMSRLHAQG